jgi:hypothetical protein
MEMRKSDVLDRWTILLMKGRLCDESKRELEQYEAEIRGWLSSGLFDAPDGGVIIESLVRLGMANARIWEQEAAIRGGDNLTLEEVGKRALLIREYNKDRVQARQAIDACFGQIQDVKVNHASERT